MKTAASKTGVAAVGMKREPSQVARVFHLQSPNWVGRSFHQLFELLAGSRKVGKVEMALGGSAAGATLASK